MFLFFYVFIENQVFAHFSRQLAHDLYIYTKATVCEKEQIESWDCGFFCDLHPDLDLIKIFENQETGVLSFVGYNNIEDRIIVAFRSTQNIQNFLNDLKFQKIDYNCLQCKVHSGFYNSYKTIQDQLIQYVENLSIQYPSSQLTIVGHSLGAALATFAAIDLTEQGLYVNTFYIFGSPRVGNKEFAQYFKKRITTKNQARITHFSDLIPHLPPQYLDYVHSVPEYWFTQNFKEYKQCQNNNEDDQCSNSIWSHSIKDHRNYFNINYKCNDDFYQQKTKDQIIL